MQGGASPQGSADNNDLYVRSDTSPGHEVFAYHRDIWGSSSRPDGAFWNSRLAIGTRLRVCSDLPGPSPGTDS